MILLLAVAEIRIMTPASSDETRLWAGGGGQPAAPLGLIV